MLQHYSQQCIEGMTYACNRQCKPGYACKANGVLFQMLGWKLISPNITFQPNTM